MGLPHMQCHFFRAYAMSFERKKCSSCNAVLCAHARHVRGNFKKKGTFEATNYCNEKTNLTRKRCQLP